LATLVSPLK